MNGEGIYREISGLAWLCSRLLGTLNGHPRSCSEPLPNWRVSRGDPRGRPPGERNPRMTGGRHSPEGAEPCLTAGERV